MEEDAGEKSDCPRDWSLGRTIKGQFLRSSQICPAPAPLTALPVRFSEPLVLRASKRNKMLQADSKAVRSRRGLWARQPLHRSLMLDNRPSLPLHLIDKHVWSLIQLLSYSLLPVDFYFL